MVQAPTITVSGETGGRVPGTEILRYCDLTLKAVTTVGPLRLRQVGAHHHRRFIRLNKFTCLL